MSERIAASFSCKAPIAAHIHRMREQYAGYVKEEYPDLSFLTLKELATAPQHGTLIDQVLFHKAYQCLLAHLHTYGNFSPLDLDRVWVGVATSTVQGGFGGFHHPGQGYRYLQQVSITSLLGSLSCSSVDRTLSTVELVRAYAHDTIHYNTYRLFLPLPGEVSGEQFFRFQYGINFRKWNGVSYSAKDSVRAKTTRNLGVIMEGATDRFAHEVVRSLVNDHPWESLRLSLYDDWIYRDCIGQLNDEDIVKMKSIEKEAMRSRNTSPQKQYLISLRLFNQYVSSRYQVFLSEFDPGGDYNLHEIILRCMLIGKVQDLCHCLNGICGLTHSFVNLFKAANY